MAVTAQACCAHSSRAAGAVQGWLLLEVTGFCADVIADVTDLSG
eukprot:COSAG05_NODE_2927_length_2496_cov_1.884022_4_plen_44_part_00